MSGWSVPIDKLAAKMQANVETVARKATLDLFTAVVKASPVDKGRFKGAWNVSYGTPNYSVGSRTDATPVGQIGANMVSVIEVVNALPIGGVMWLSNGLAYGPRLEYGWSKQAPSGMVRIAVSDFSRFVQRNTR